MDCPLPHEERAVITTAHGSGGKLMHDLLEKCVFKYLDNGRLATRHDGAILDINGPLAFSTDSYVVSPIVFPGGNIGELAVNGTVNDLAMCGAMADSLSLSLILEEGLEIAMLERILQTIANTASAAGVLICTGDTKVVERGKGDQIYINTSGIGKIHQDAAIDAARIRAGMEIVLSNDIAAHGMAIMSVRDGLGFASDVQSDTRPLHFAVQELLHAHGKNIVMLRDATRGGLATVLNEWAVQTGLGIEIEQKLVPVQSDVRSLCEVLGIDPMYVANEGVFAVVVPGGTGQRVAEMLANREDCSRAVCIGRFTEGHPRKVVSISPFGGKRVLGMLSGDPLPRIC
jgi:hydrogenase expression/formation protein HypE